MTDKDMLTNEAERHPIVRIETGEAMADSRDVAAYFGKNHFDVLKAIRNMACSEEFRERNFASIKIKDLSGESTSHVTMTKDGFMFLVLGFTGAKAASLKEAYIGQFNAMERELMARRGVDPLAVLNDPSAMRGLLLNYSEKVLALEEKVADMAPAVEALDRIAEAHGTFCRSTAAKMLQIPPHTLCRWLRTNGWTFRRPGDKDDLAYQSKIASGMLEHKVTTGQRPDGTEWSSTQVRVTGKGLTALAKAFPPAAQEVA